MMDSFKRVGYALAILVGYVAFFSFIDRTIKAPVWSRLERKSAVSYAVLRMNVSVTRLRASTCAKFPAACEGP